MTLSSVYILVAVLFVGFLSAAPSKNDSTRTRNNIEKRATQVLTASTTNTTVSSESESSCEMKYDKLNESIVIQQGIQDLMSQYNNWGTLLTHVPVATGILGQLTLMAYQNMEFPINSQHPHKIYKHIEYPNSFRKTLIQISRQSHRAFFLAHNNMNAIRNTNNRAVPDVIKDAVIYLTSKNVQIIKQKLPYTLGKINEAVKRSQNLAIEVVNEFNLILSLIEETELEVSSTRRGAESWLNVTTFEVMLENRAKELSEQEESILEKKDAKLKTIMGKFEHHTGHLFYLNRYNDIDESIYYRNFFQSNSCAQKNGQKLLDILITFGEYRERYEHWQNPNNQPNLIFDGTKAINDIEHALEKLEECPEVNGIITKGFDLMEQLRSSINFNSTNKATKRPFSDEIAQIVILINNLRKTTNEETEESGKQEEVILVNDSLDIFSISKPYRQLISVSKTIEDIINLNNNLTEIRRQKIELILDRITKLDINKVNVGQVVLTLKSSLVELSQMRDEWGKLIVFFENINNFVNVAFRYSTGLVEVVETLSDYPEEIFKEQILFNDLINNVEKSKEAVLLVHRIASTYLKVSDRHIMMKVVRLGTLNNMMSYSTKTDELLQQEKERLSKDSWEASRGIDVYFIQKVKKLNRTLKARHQEIFAEYKQLFTCLNKTSLLDHNFPDDYWFQLESRMNGKVLEVSSGNHSVVRMWDSHGKDNQLWYVDENQIIRSFATDGCLTSRDISGMVNVEPCKDTPNQKWMLNNSTIVNAVDTNICLDIIIHADKLDSAHIVEYECHHRANQQWNIKYQ